MDTLAFIDSQLMYILGSMVGITVIAVIFALEIINRRKPQVFKCERECSYCACDPLPEASSPRSRAKLALFHLEFALVRKDQADIARSLYEIDQCAMELAHGAGCAEGEQAFEDFAKACHAYARREQQKPLFPGDPVRTCA